MIPFNPDDETFAERIAALKDIIPPTTRLAIVDTFDSIASWTAWTAKKAGGAAWIVTTSALLVGLPLMLSIEGEAALVQQEKEYLGQVSSSTHETCTPAWRSVVWLDGDAVS